MANAVAANAGNSAITLPLAFATAIKPINGIPTAVIKKPNIAKDIFSPASMPAKGGKIKLPAPKKNAKVINPNPSVSVTLILVVCTTSLVLLLCFLTNLIDYAIISYC